MDELIPIISAAAGVLAAGLPIIWRLASRLQKMESSLEVLGEDLKGRIASLESDIDAIKEAAEKAATLERGGRKEIWVEVSALRERLVKLETKINGGSP